MSLSNCTTWTPRMARAEDIPAVEALIPVAVRGLQAAQYGPAQMDAALGSVFGVDRQLIADGTYFVLEDAGRIVGCGGWSKRKSMFGGDHARAAEDELIDPARKPARVRAFFVHPEFARRGIGRAILAACERAIRESGFQVAELVATLTGEPFYAAFAYEAVERFEVPLIGGLTLPVVRMSKRLTPDSAQRREAELSGIRYYLRFSPRLATSGQPNDAQFAQIAGAGFDSVINLALPTSTHALANEGDLVAAQGMEYIHIPVEWEAPKYEDFTRFAAALEQRADGKVFIHCAKNMRVSVFMFLYRTLVQGVPVAEAERDVLRIWEPDKTWRTFIDDVSSRWRNSSMRSGELP